MIKHKIISRGLVVILAAALVLAIPTSAFATEIENPPVTEEAPVSRSISGTCGENLEWNYQDGVLTITGSGAMADYSAESPAPWYDLRQQITQLSLPQGMTSVGSYAFTECKYLEVVQLPDSVVSVGEKAFFACTSMDYLTLGDGLQSIGESAFERCLSLTSIHLPQGLRSIGDLAFWRCESLMAVTVPSSVTDLGRGVFAHCKSLIRATVNASVSEIPSWLFFGCTALSSVHIPSTTTAVEEYAFYECQALSTVSYQGSDAERIDQEIQQSMTDMSGYNMTVEQEGSSTHIDYTETETGTSNQVTTVTQTEHATVGTVVDQTFPVDSTRADSISANITATVTEPEGWQTVVEQMNAAVKEYGTQLKNSSDTNVIKTQVNVPQGDSLDSTILSQFAGQPVHLTVQTIGGSSWTIDCSTLEAGTLTGTYDLSYTLEAAEAQWQEKLGGATTYLLKFRQDCTINAELLIRLPSVPAGHNAFLYQRSGSELEHLQAVLVDDSGYAHFYLANVDSGTEYFIGIDVPQADTSQVLVPENMYPAYDITDTVEKIEFVITGRKSSWGMEISQVTWILAGVIVASVGIVGGVLYLMNKRKLKMGYVPDLSE